MRLRRFGQHRCGIENGQRQLKGTFRKGCRAMGRHKSRPSCPTPHASKRGSLLGQNVNFRPQFPRGGWPALSVSFLPVPELWVPRPCAFCKGGYDAACTMLLVMPSGLHRTYGAHHLHFITCSCYRRLPFLRTARSRDRFLSILEQTRQRYRFVVVGYVVMPEHVHLLLTEPEVGTPSTVMQVLKQRTARALLPKKQTHGPAPAQSVCRRAATQSILAGALLRLQRVDDEEARGEAAVHASQSGEAGTGGIAGAMALEQLSFLPSGRGGPVRVNEGWTKISFRDRAA